MRSFKLKVFKYFILDQSLFRKDLGGIMLNFVEEYEAQIIMNEMHNGGFGGHSYWKATAYKILRVRYCWTSLFSNVFAKVRTCMECQIFARKQKLQPLPLKIISVDVPFQ